MSKYRREGSQCQDVTDNRFQIFVNKVYETCEKIDKYCSSIRNRVNGIVTVFVFRRKFLKVDILTNTSAYKSDRGRDLIFGVLPSSIQT